MEGLFGISTFSISIENFSKKFDKVSLFENMNLTLSEKGIYFLFGENGSGKTTFFKCLANLESFKGSIKYSTSKDIFCIFDDNPLYLNITGYQNVKILSNASIDKEKLTMIVKKYYSNENIFFKSKVKSLSMGQKKMVSLILLEYLQPRYIFLDEILNGLDINSRKIVLDVLTKMKTKSLIILSGHENLYIHISDHFFCIKNKNVLKVKKKILIEKFSKLGVIDG